MNKKFTKEENPELEKPTRVEPKTQEVHPLDRPLVKDEQSMEEAKEKADRILLERMDRGIKYGEKEPRLPKFLRKAGYHYHWTAERNVRIRENQGYEKCMEYEKEVVTDSRGGKTYLMRIPLEIYNMDRKAKQREIDALEDSIFRAINKNGASVPSDRLYGHTTLNTGNPQTSRSYQFR